MMDQNDQNDRFDRFDRFEPDFSRLESASDRSERSSSLDRSERPARTGRRQPARPVRSGMRMGKGKPMRRASVKLNYPRGALHCRAGAAFADNHLRRTVQVPRQ